LFTCEHNSLHLKPFTPNQTLLPSRTSGNGIDFIHYFILIAEVFRVAEVLEATIINITQKGDTV
jgi:hypothetical protein